MTSPEAVPKNFVAQTGELPQTLMHVAIAELTAAGEGELAAELEELREQWSKAVRRRAALGPRPGRRDRLEQVLLRLGNAIGLSPFEQATACVRLLRQEAEHAR
jgi:hypothetical protein